MFIKRICVLLVALAWSAAAQAGVYSFEFESINTSGNQFTVVGDVVAANFFDQLGGADILSISGQVIGPGGGAITGLIANSNQPFPEIYANGTYDNVGYPSKPWVDTNGVLFTANGFTYRLYAAEAVVVPGFQDFYYLSTNNPSGVLQPGTPGYFGTMLVQGVPEPSTWALLLAGFAAFVMIGRGQKRLARLATQA